MKKLSPIKDIKSQNKIIKLLETKADNRVTMFWKLSVKTGFRTSTMCSIKLNNINFENKTISAIEGKTNKKITMPLSNKMIQELEKYIADNNITNYLFEAKRTGHISRAWIYSKLAIVKSIIKNFSCYCSRKTFAYNCYIASNCNINLVQELLQHSSPSITRRYLCLDEEDFRSVIDLIG